VPYPIVEFDNEAEAFIEPSRVISRRDVPEHCVLCFFKEVIDKVTLEHHAKVAVANSWEDGPHPIYEIEFRGKRLAYTQPGIGSGLSVGLLEETIAYGCRKFVACGGCGTLDSHVAAGHLVCISAAVRDEGASYHYLPPSREVTANPQVLEALEKVLKTKEVPFTVGKAWTTDAPYRETRGRIARRKEEGCIVVEMEAAAMMAVAEFRQVLYGQIVYGGDDLSGTNWDNRQWQSKKDVRESLFWLCAEAVLSI
jgi:uridine phosphorylase